MSLLAKPSVFDDAFLSVSATPHAAVVSVQTATVREHQAEIMHRRLTQLARQCGGRLAVGFEGVTGMTSACINTLVEVTAECRRAGGRLVIFGLTRPLRTLFRNTGLDHVLSVTEDATSALRSLTPPASSPRRGFWPFRWGDAA